MDGSVDTGCSSKASLFQSDIDNKVGVRDDKVYGDVAKFFVTDEMNDNQVKAQNAQNQVCEAISNALSCTLEDKKKTPKIFSDGFLYWVCIFKERGSWVF